MAQHLSLRVSCAFSGKQEQQNSIFLFSLKLFLHLFYYTKSLLWHGTFCPVAYQRSLDSCSLYFF